MALTKGTNSYVTLDEAVTYFEDRLDVAAWENASELQRNQSLITATKVLDSLDWTGVAVSDSQNLAFPRDGSYFDPRLGMTTTLNSVTAANRIANATYELAYHLLNNDGLLDNTGDVNKLQLGSISLENIRRAEKLPSIVKNLIKPLTVNKGSNAWWRAN